MKKLFLFISILFAATVLSSCYLDPQYWEDWQVDECWVDFDVHRSGTYGDSPIYLQDCNIQHSNTQKTGYSFARIYKHKLDNTVYFSFIPKFPSGDEILGEKDSFRIIEERVYSLYDDLYYVYYYHGYIYIYLMDAYKEVKSRYNANEIHTFDFSKILPLDIYIR